MKIVIAYSPDPVYLGPFIYKIIEIYGDKIAGVLCTRGSITKRKNRIQQIEYFFSLLLILGIKYFFRNLFIMLRFKITKDNRIKSLCEKKDIPFMEVKSVNGPDAMEFMKKLGPDVIFNQSHHIVKKEVLELPSKGVLNRHGAFLPEYRGRLSPFWQLFNGEGHGGLSYHLLDEGIDSGPIVHQVKIPIEKNDDFNSLVAKIFKAAVENFGPATEKLDSENWRDMLIKNDPERASYFSVPGFRDALKFRIKRIFGNA